MSDERALRDAVALVFVDDLEHPALSQVDAHHLVEVLRVGTSELVAASDGEGRYRLCSLEANAPGEESSPSRRRGRVRAGDVVLRSEGAITAVPPPEPRVTVGFAIPKGDRAEWIIQKLTELGVDVIVPLLTEHTVVRLADPDRAKRGERFRRVAREAAAQCRRTRLPSVLDPTDLDALPPDLLAGAVLAEPGGAGLSSGVSTVLIGPEGGWSEAELGRGLGTVHLADHVLRAETAAMAAAVLVCAARSGVVSLAP